MKSIADLTVPNMVRFEWTVNYVSAMHINRTQGKEVGWKFYILGGHKALTDVLPVTRAMSSLKADLVLYVGT